jgi:hypothetical protein
MRSPHRATAFTALLALILAPALTISPASGSTPHRTAQAVPAGAAAPLTVRIDVAKTSMTLSTDTIRPGNTMFELASAGGGGTVEVVRLRKGFDVMEFRDTFIKAMEQGDVKAVRKLDRRAVFYGGMPVDKHGVNMFGFELGRGHYLVVNPDRDMFTTFTVAGRHHAGRLPKADSRINYVGEDRFGGPASLASHGWMKQTNKTDEPHFTDLQKVKKSTTKRTVAKYFASGAQAQPKWVLGEMAEGMVLSPGHSMVWKYDVSHGKYIALCWWPSAENGMPHAMMGMWRLLNLK